jgi:hypothetical protein
MQAIKGLGMIALGLFALGAGSAGAMAQSTIAVGTLTCSGKGGAGMIIGSEKTFACVFTPDGGGRKEKYSATLTRVGLDIGVTGPTKLTWAVMASKGGLAKGALAGTYAGAAADASLTQGGGGSVLVGGSMNTVALQPISVQDQMGTNLAVGVASLTLK